MMKANIKSLKEKDIFGYHGGTIVEQEVLSSNTLKE